MKHPSPKTTPLTQSKIHEDSRLMSVLMGESRWEDALSWVKENPHVATGKLRSTANNSGFMIGSPMLNVAVKFDRLALVKALVEAGAPLEGRTRDGETSLFIAFERCSAAGMKLHPANDGPAAIADYLIDAGCKIVTYKSNGNSPLDETSGDIPLRYVKVMIDAGMSLNTFHKASSMPMVSHLVYTSEMTKLKKRREVLEEIIRARPNLNPVARNYRDFPLVQAMLYGAVDLAELMIAHGADPLHQAIDEKSLLFAARMPESAQWVLRKFPGLLDKPDHTGRTPLMEFVELALSAGNEKTALLAEESAKVLITAGANLDALDDQGPALCKSPRQMILKKPSHSLCEFLKKWLASQQAHKALYEINQNHWQRPQPV